MGRREDTMDIREIICQVRMERSNQAIGRDTSIDRRTVAKCLVWAERQRLLEGTRVELGGLHRLLEETLRLLPRRWVAECSFGRMARSRRLARDYERLPDMLKGLHCPGFRHTDGSSLRSMCGLLPIEFIKRSRDEPS